MTVLFSNPAVLNEAHWFFTWSMAILILELLNRLMGMFVALLIWVTIFLFYLARVHPKVGEGAKSPRDHLLCAILDLALVLASFVGYLWLIVYIYLMVDLTKDEYQGKNWMSTISTDYLIVKLFLSHISGTGDFALIYMIFHVFFAPIEWIFNKIL